MRVGQRLYLVGMGLLFATSALAVQKVTPVKDTNGTVFAGAEPNWSATVPAGTQLVIFGRYTSDLANESGLGLQVQFDSTKFSSVNVDQAFTFTKCMVALPQTDVAGKITFGWADTSIRRTGGVPNGVVGWTGTADPAQPGQPDGCLNPGGNTVTTSAASGPPVNLFRIVATTLGTFTSGTSTITLLPTSFSKAAGQNAAAPVTQALVVTGAAAPLCNLDVDNDGAVLPLKDGVLLARALNPNISDANVTVGINITGNRNTGALIRQYLNTFLTGVPSANLGASVLDVDGNGSTTALADGVAIKRALNGNTTSAGVVFGLALTPGTTGASIRAYLNSHCGTSL